MIPTWALMTCGDLSDIILHRFGTRRAAFSHDDPTKLQSGDLHMPVVLCRR
jgi:hypothetical protein